MFFCSVTTLSIHISTVHEGNKSNKVFSQGHDKENQTQKDSFKCRICIKTFPSRGSLKTHTDGVHKAKKLNKISCDFCDATFNSKENLTSHVANSHLKTGEKLYACIECNAKFPRQDTLQIHYHTKHDLNATKKQATTAEPEVKKNVATAHQVQKIKCDFCYATFKATSHLMRHLSHSHMEKKLYSCIDCNAEFDGKDTLEIHYHTTHEKPHQCQICAKRFADKEKLSNHVNTHTKQQIENMQMNDKAKLTSGLNPSIKFN